MKDKKWIGFNILLFIIFLGIYASAVFLIDLLEALFMFFILYCYIIFLLIVNIIGIIYFWKKGALKYALKILAVSIASYIFTYFSFPIYQRTSYFINYQRGLTEKQIETRTEKKL